MSESLLPADILDLARRVVEENRAAGRKIALAESCTGGLVAAAITEIPGSSAVFDRGFVTYSNEAKRETLGVSNDVIEAFGAVSIACVYAMAQGALEHSRADVAVAISGIAGPDGGTPDKPVGTVCFAWASADGILKSETLHFEGDREAVRYQSVKTALEGVLDLTLVPDL